MSALNGFITGIGYIGIFLVLFSETGLLVGFFLPGDSLLFAAGLLASQGYISLPLVIIAGFFGAVLGNFVGYYLGEKFGYKIFREKSTFFRPEYVSKIEQFYKKFGRVTIILARFVPIVRTGAAVLAGIGKMNKRKFFIDNIIGGVLWTAGIPIASYYLGNKIPNIDTYIFPIIIAVVVLSSLPTTYLYIRSLFKKKK